MWKPSRQRLNDLAWSLAANVISVPLLYLLAVAFGIVEPHREVILALLWAAFSVAFVAILAFFTLRPFVRDAKGVWRSTRSVKLFVAYVIAILAIFTISIVIANLYIA